MEQKRTRLNSEKTITNDNFKIKIGTTNNVDPQVIYVEGRTFIQPGEEKNDYTRDILDIKKSFNSALKNNLKDSNLFHEKYILDFQVAQSGISYEKKSFLSFQFLMRQKNERKILKLKDIKEASSGLINNIMDEICDNIEKHNFIMSKTKK